MMVPKLRIQVYQNLMLLLFIVFLFFFEGQFVIKKLMKITKHTYTVPVNTIIMITIYKSMSATKILLDIGFMFFNSILSNWHDIS